MIPARKVMDVHVLCFVMNELLLPILTAQCSVFCDELVATTHTDCTVHLLSAPYLKCLMLSVCVYQQDSQLPPPIAVQESSLQPTVPCMCHTHTEQDKCGDRLETNVQKRRNLRLITYNIPDEVTLENAEDIICVQNSTLALNKRDITTKFIFKTKRKERNLVIELAPQTHRLLLQNKLKFGWMICNTDDYISVNRCCKWSRFNHYFSDCRTKRRALCAQESTN